MKRSSRTLAPWLVAAAISGAIAFAPTAGAAVTTAPVTNSATPPSSNTGTDPLVPYGTEPSIPYRLGYVDSDHDEANTTNGQLDLPF